jgi:hypothetical protein
VGVRRARRPHVVVVLLVQFDLREEIRLEQRQCCGSGMIIPDPNFCSSRIPNLGSKNSKKRWVKKICCPFLPFFVAANYHKVETYFIFELVKKNFWANLQRTIELFTPKIVINLSKKRF